MVWLEIDHLGEFHLDYGTLLAVIVGGFLFHGGFGVPGERFFITLAWIISLGILVALVRNRSKIPKTNMHWLAIGFLIACLFLIPTTFLESLQAQKWAGSIPSSGNLLIIAIRNISFQLSFVSPLEEIIFRGFVWGYMRRMGWSENRAFWGQALLFWLSHITKIGTPITFFITIPIGIVFFSLLTRYSKQLAPSIVMHTIINAFLPISIYLLTGIR